MPVMWNRFLSNLFPALSKTYGLPVTVSRISFDKLLPASRKADIVLFMELLHWVVSQGLELRKVIRRLAQLAEQILYVEFPWSLYWMS